MIVYAMYPNSTFVVYPPHKNADSATSSPNRLQYVDAYMDNLLCSAQGYPTHHNHTHVMLCFIIFFCDDCKKDSSTTISYRKRIIKLLKKKIITSNILIKIWESTYGSSKNYRCTTALYTISMLSQDFYVVI